MNFRQQRVDDEPEINLIPLIDVLLVILIFLAATTSFTRYSQLKVALPQAQADAIEPSAINLAISQDGLYALNGQLLSNDNIDEIANALRQASHGHKPATLIINADAQSTHQSVVLAMQAARLAGINRVNFATQSAP